MPGRATTGQQWRRSGWRWRRRLLVSGCCGRSGMGRRCRYPKGGGGQPPWRDCCLPHFEPVFPARGGSLSPSSYPCVVHRTSHQSGFGALIVPYPSCVLVCGAQYAPMEAEPPDQPGHLRGRRGHGGPQRRGRRPGEEAEEEEPIREGSWYGGIDYWIFLDPKTLIDT